MPPSRSRIARRPSAKLALFALGAATALAPMLIGGSPGWSVPIIAALGIVAAALAIFAAWRGHEAMPIGLGLAVLTFGTLFTILQAAPLPCDLAERLAPDAVSDARRAAALVGAAARCTITQDPGRTREEILKGLTLLSFFVAATLTLRVTRREDVLRVVALSAALVGLVMLGHVIFDAEAIWGVYRPLYGRALYGPFVNPNHAGGIFALGAPVALGIGLSREARPRRGPWLVLAAFLVACAAITLSRGAILAVVGGMGLFALLYARREASRVRRSERSTLQSLLLRSHAAGVMAALVAAALVVFAAGIERLQGEFEGGDLSKIELGWRGLELALTGPWLGVGRGAFAVAFVERTPEAGVRYEYAENAITQWAVDWGLVVGLLVAALLALAIVRAARSTERLANIGAVAGIVAYASQNLVDFGLEMIGSAAVAVVLLAAVVAPGHGPSERASTTSRDGAGASPSLRLRASAWLKGGRSSLAAAASIVVISAIALAMLGGEIEAQRVESARATLEERFTVHDRDGFRVALGRAVVAHPREPIFALLAGAEAARADDPQAIAFLSRAMLLAPSWTGPHLTAARLLMRLGRVDQAWVELRQALAVSPPLALGPACELLRLRPSAHALFRMLPERDPERTAALRSLATCVPTADPRADEIDRALVEASPSLDLPRIRLARRALERHHPEDARRWLTLDERHATPELELARAELELAGGEPEEALEQAERAERRGADRWQATVLRARALATLQRWDAMRDAVGELRGLAGSSPARLGDVEVFLGGLERGAGHRGRALAAFESAWRSFERLDALVAVAQLSAELGDDERARGARRSLCERDRTDYCDAPLEPPRP